MSTTNPSRLAPHLRRAARHAKTLLDRMDAATFAYSHDDRWGKEACEVERHLREILRITSPLHEFNVCTCPGGGPAGLHASYCRTWETR